MSSEAEREIFRALRDSQSKYTYFQLAAAGAGIGFALTQTQNEHLVWTQFPLGIAVLMWGLSFYSGCRHLEYVSSTLYGNAEMLRVEAGRHPDIENHPQYMQAASEGIRKALETNINIANRLGYWQFRLLVGGGVFYIAWHILEMGIMRSA